jgi:hypothetical protein
VYVTSKDVCTSAPATGEEVVAAEDGARVPDAAGVGATLATLGVVVELNTDGSTVVPEGAKEGVNDPDVNGVGTGVVGTEGEGTTVELNTDGDKVELAMDGAGVVVLGADVVGGRIEPVTEGANVELVKDGADVVVVGAVVVGTNGAGATVEPSTDGAGVPIVAEGCTVFSGVVVGVSTV